MKQETETKQEETNTKTQELIAQLRSMQNALYLKAKDKSVADVTITYKNSLLVPTNNEGNIKSLSVDFEKSITRVVFYRHYINSNVAEIIGLSIEEMESVVREVEENRLYDAYNSWVRSICQQNSARFI